MPENPLIVALDVSESEEAIRLCHQLKDKVKIFKIGLQLFLSGGQEIVQVVKSLGGEVFLDLKLCDIPNQVVGACRQIVGMGVKMFTLHTTGGFEMMKKAAEATRAEALKRKVPPPLMLGVTVLTSLDQSALREWGIERGIIDQVVYLATLAKDAGLDGVVASPQEISAIRKAIGPSTGGEGGRFLVVTPGVRPEWFASCDQRRVLTPAQAVQLGASYIVVGRPVIESTDPVEAVSKILEEIKGAIS
ncbi:MAG TPA: orotidine-5'-phosphate decarboxylase [Actinobacteria bacterium]|nr:orotidine-5'-phosphate decarboxylase [Actinomycetota bacterium]